MSPNHQTGGLNMSQLQLDLIYHNGFKKNLYLNFPKY